MIHHDLLQSLEVQNVSKDIRSILEHCLAGLDDVREYHAIVAILRAQQLGALDAQLAETTCRRGRRDQIGLAL